MSARTRNVLLGLVAGALSAGAFVAPPAAQAGAASLVGTQVQQGAGKVTAHAKWRVNGTASALVLTSDRIYLGGDFASVTSIATGRTVARRGLVALNRHTGGLVRSWHPAVTGVVRSLAASPGQGRLFVGGRFTAVNGENRLNVAALSLSTGALSTGFSTSATGGVFALQSFRSSLYLGGNFERVNGDIHRSLAAVSLDTGALVPGWDAAVQGGSVRALAVARDRKHLLVGGGFDSLGGRSRINLGSVGLLGGGVTRWSPKPLCIRCSVLDLDTSGVRTFAATSGPGGRVASYNSSTAALVWTRHANGDVQALDYFKGRLYIGGHFSRVYNLVRHQIAAIDPQSARVLRFRVDFARPYHPGIRSLRAAPDFLNVAGGFTSVNGRNLRGFVQLRVS